MAALKFVGGVTDTLMCESGGAGSPQLPAAGGSTIEPMPRPRKPRIDVIVGRTAADHLASAPADPPATAPPDVDTAPPAAGDFASQLQAYIELVHEPVADAALRLEQVDTVARRQLQKTHLHLRLVR